MSSPTPVAAAQPRWMTSTGRVISAVPVLLLLMSALFALSRSPKVIQGMRMFGYPESAIVIIGCVALAPALLYAIPATAVLGAILMTAYLGAAAATHIRVADPGYPFAIIVAIFVWVGLYLRDERVRALLPLRRPMH